MRVRVLILSANESVTPQNAKHAFIYSPLFEFQATKYVLTATAPPTIQLCSTTSSSTSLNLLTNHLVQVSSIVIITLRKIGVYKNQIKLS